MIDNTNGVSDAPAPSDSVAPQEINTQVLSENSDNSTVQYQTHKRALSQLKNAQSENDNLKARLEAVSNEKLEAEGNKDELINSLKKQMMEKDVKLKATVGSIARTQAMSAIVDEAVKAGCNSPDIVKKYLEDQIGSLTFDGDFNPDREQVKLLIEDTKRTSPILFSKDAPRVASHNINAAGVSKTNKPDIKKLSIDELMNTWAETENN
jgi:hypothetical protein